MSVSVSLLSIYYYRSAFSDTTWHESNTPPQSLVNRHNTYLITTILQNYTTTKQVLMLNTCLTVRKGEANSHQKKGWEEFTDAVIRALAQREGLVYVFCNTSQLLFPPFFSCLWTLCLSLIHLLLPACIL
jgi:hypothetical protein